VLRLSRTSRASRLRGPAAAAAAPSAAGRAARARDRRGRRGPADLPGPVRRSHVCGTPAPASTWGVDPRLSWAPCLQYVSTPEADSSGPDLTSVDCATLTNPLCPRAIQRIGVRRRPVGRTAVVGFESPWGRHLPAIAPRARPSPQEQGAPLRCRVHVGSWPSRMCRPTRIAAPRSRGPRLTSRGETVSPEMRKRDAPFTEAPSARKRRTGTATTWSPPERLRLECLCP
jgi:hypothetical protein